MPTERFQRLSEEMKNVIYRSLQKEFTRVPFEQASINRIVQGASISRGSFYTYFADKYDALSYVLEETMDAIRCRCGEFLRDNGGEYLGMIQSLFEYLVSNMQNTGELLNLAKNITHDMSDEFLFHYEEEEFHKRSDADRENFSQWILTHIDSRRLRIQTTAELYSMIELGYAVLLRHLREYYRHPEALASIRGMLNTDLEIIRHGVYRVPYVS